MPFPLSQYSTVPSPVKRWRTPALLALAGLAGAALYVNKKTRQVEADHPPTGKFIEVDGVRLHYTEQGSGDPLVLLHGNGITSSDFEASGLTARAAERYRVIAFDRPGFGYSERPRSTIWTPEKQARLLHKALEQLGIENPIVLGHSWGTLVALSMALAFPQDVRGLVLLSGYYYPSLRLDVPLLSQPAIPVIGDLMRYTISPLVARLIWPLAVKRIFSPAPVPESFKRLPVWMMLRPSQLRASAAESALMIPSAMKLAKRYSELTMPVRIVVGKGDKIAVAGHNSERLDEALSDSRIDVEHNVGHMVHYARPDDVIKAIDSVHAGAGMGPLKAQFGDGEFVAGHA